MSGPGFEDWKRTRRQLDGTIDAAVNDYDWLQATKVMDQVSPLAYRFDAEFNDWVVDAGDTVRVWHKSLPRAILKACETVLEEKTNDGET